MTITEKEWFIEAPWGRLCIVAWGHCYKPPVLLCHGLRDSIVSFRPLIQQLPKDFYYIGVEFPGNGKSDPFPLGLLMNFYDLVYCVDVVVKHFRWENFTFMGHSAGATVGLMYDFCVPAKVSRLILLDPIPRVVEPNEFVQWYKRSYQALFDDFDYYNNQIERRPLYSRDEALSKLLKVDGMSEELALANLERLTEEAGDGRLRFTSDQRYNLIASAPFTPEQLKGLCLRSQAQMLVFATSQCLELGWYSKTQFLLDETIYNNTLRARRVGSHHNIHLNPPDLVVASVSQFLLHGPEGLGANAKL